MGGLHKMNQFLYYLSFYSSGIPFDARDPSQKISRNSLSYGIISPETSKYIRVFVLFHEKILEFSLELAASPLRFGESCSILT